MLIPGSAVYHLCLLIFAVLLISAALSDTRSLTIPNRLTAAIALLYPAYVLASPKPVDWLMAIAIAGGVLVVAAGLFAAGYLGGGDAKMLAATTLWAGPELAFTFVVFTALAGGVVSMVILLQVRYGWAIGMPAAADATQNVPYGVAIAAGGLLVAFILFLS